MSTQLALRLPDETLTGLDWLVVRCKYSSRTEAMRAAIEAAIAAERRKQIDEQYVEAYTRMPQTEEELADLAWQSPADLDDEDWEEWL
jgi:Arc/MetJ-type ribon-helix-helix transcriptional regulator